jgi:hypothetical protein
MPRPETAAEQVGEVTGVELDAAPRRERAVSEHDDRRVAIGPAVALRLERQRTLVGPGPHQVAVDRREKRGDVGRSHHRAALEGV